MKPYAIIHILFFLVSHSARSAWIETMQAFPGDESSKSRTPQGVRGLKLSIVVWFIVSGFVALRKECVD